MPTLEEGLRLFFQGRGTNALLIGEVILTTINPWRLSQAPATLAEKCGLQLRAVPKYGDREHWNGIPADAFDGRYDQVYLADGTQTKGNERRYEVRYVRDVEGVEKALDGRPFTKLY